MAIRSNGRGTLVFKRVIPGIGPVRRASGTNDPAVFAQIHAEVDDLVARGSWTALRQLRDGQMRPLGLLGYQATFGRVSDPRPRPSTFCYIIQAQPSGYLKIGCAVEPVVRLRELQCATWESLTILVTMPGGWEAEQRLHREFAAHRIIREWFRPAPEILALVDEITSGGAT